MIKRVQQYFSTLPAVFIDGTLYVCVGLFTFLTASFSSDDAAKYVSPETLFWVKVVLGSAGTVALNMKMFRSTTFADHQVEKKKTGNTDFITKP
jgi:hypothetical protein